jgi:protein tyrosine/serine phosphatase
VHCAQGVRRTGMMVAAYQESVLGYDRERATQEILRFGHSDRSIGDVRRFIDVYDPVKREVTAELPHSSE